MMCCIQDSVYSYRLCSTDVAWEETGAFLVVYFKRTFGCSSYFSKNKQACYNLYRPIAIVPQSQNILYPRIFSLNMSIAIVAVSDKK